MKALAETKREIIFSELIASHPKPLTVKDIVDNTHIAVSTVRKALKEFEHNKFIIPYEKPRRRGKRKTGEKIIRKPEVPFILENSSYHFNKLHNFKFQLAPGYIQYTNEFLRIYPTLVDEAIQGRVRLLLVKFIEEVFRRIHTPRYGLDKVLSSEINNKSLCPNCGFNHEARDLIRAILIHSIDELERTNEFIDLLEKQHLISDEVYSRLKEDSITFNHQGTRISDRLKRLRLLSVNRAGVTDMILFIAIDGTRNFFYGNLNSDIAQNLTPGMIIECDPSVVDARSDGWLYTSISDDDYIRILDPNLPLPTFSDVKSTIKEIKSLTPSDYFSSPNKVFFLEGFVTGSTRFVSRYLHGQPVTAIDTMIAGPGGQIRLIGHICDETSISEGDRIQVLGASVVPQLEGDVEYEVKGGSVYVDGYTEMIVDIELSLVQYGSLVKLDRPDSKLIIDTDLELEFHRQNKMLREKDHLLMAYVKEFIDKEKGVRNSVEVVPTLKFYEYFPEFKSVISSLGTTYECQIKRYDDGSVKKIKILRKIRQRESNFDEQPSNEKSQGYDSLDEPARDNGWIITHLNKMFAEILEKYYSS